MYDLNSSRRVLFPNSNTLPNHYKAFNPLIQFFFFKCSNFRFPSFIFLPVTWFVGIALIIFSFDATWQLHRLSACQNHHCLTNPNDYHIQFPSKTLEKLNFVPNEGLASGISITIFTAPRPFIGKDSDHQWLALRSWMQLHPLPLIVLVGNHPSFRSVATKHPSIISVEEDVDSSLDGSPLFHSMVSRARACGADVAVLIRPDVILLPDFAIVLRKMKLMKDDWLLGAIPWNVTHFPFQPYSSSSSSSSSNLWKLSNSHQLFHAKEVKQYVLLKGSLRERRSFDVWAFNPSSVPIHSGPMPPFVTSSNKHYSEWLLNEAIGSNLRTVVDASYAITAVHVAHSPPHDSNEFSNDVLSLSLNLNLNGTAAPRKETVNQKWIAERKVEMYELNEKINAYLSFKYGSFSIFKYSVYDVNIILIPCTLDHSGGYCFFSKRNSSIYFDCNIQNQNQIKSNLSKSLYSLSSLPNHSSHVIHPFEFFPKDKKERKTETVRRHSMSMFDFFKSDKVKSNSVENFKGFYLETAEKRIYNSVQMRKDFAFLDKSKLFCELKFHAAKIVHSSISQTSNVSKNVYLPYSMEELLSIFADENRMIILTIVARNYFEFLMSWKCSLSKFKVQNFIVCALDDESYLFSLLQGLPVFRFKTQTKSQTQTNFQSQTQTQTQSQTQIRSNFGLDRDNCHFGTECFQKVTKMKSRIVLSILSLGYHVFFNDVDVYWFKNPIHELWNMSAKGIVVQSDNWNVTDADNAKRRINSGFYLVRSEPNTISAFSDIVMHASKSNMSEQPSFYDTLCGENEQFRVDFSECWNPKYGVRVLFLNRTRYPNGAVGKIWDKDTRRVCEAQGCVILHNNWVANRQIKFARQMKQGLFDFDLNSRMCFRKWRNANSSRVF